MRYAGYASRRGRGLVLILWMRRLNCGAGESSECPVDANTLNRTRPGWQSLIDIDCQQSRRRSGRIELWSTLYARYQDNSKLLEHSRPLQNGQHHRASASDIRWASPKLLRPRIREATKTPKTAVYFTRAGTNEKRGSAWNLQFELELGMQAGMPRRGRRDLVLACGTLISNQAGTLNDGKILRLNHDGVSAKKV